MARGSRKEGLRGLYLTLGDCGGASQACHSGRNRPLFLSRVMTA